MHCNKCNRPDLTRSDMVTDGARKRGYRNICRKCDCKVSMAWYARRKAELNEDDEVAEFRRTIMRKDLPVWEVKLDYIKWMGWSVEDKAGEVDDILEGMQK